MSTCRNLLIASCIAMLRLNDAHATNTAVFDIDVTNCLSYGPASCSNFAPFSFQQSYLIGDDPTATPHFQNGDEEISETSYSTFAQPLPSATLTSQLAATGLSVADVTGQMQARRVIPLVQPLSIEPYENVAIHVTGSSDVILNGVPVSSQVFESSLTATRYDADYSVYDLDSAAGAHLFATLGPVRYFSSLTDLTATGDITSELIYTGQARLSLYDSLPITAAVPEPESWALLLAGMGWMGIVACRRKRQPDQPPKYPA